MNNRTELITQIAELIELAGALVYAGNNLATELAVCVDAAREAGCELQEAELFLNEWNALINPSQRAAQ